MSTTETGGRWPADRPVAKRAFLATLLVAAGAIGVFYVLLPNLAGLDDTWQRINQGDPWWLGLALFLELASFAGYMALFRAVFARDQERIDWRLSYQLTMAGLGATRLFATAGLGGILLTVWALRRVGMSPRDITRRMTAFLVLLYGVFMLSLVIGGLGLRLGLFPGSAPFGLTVVPAVFGGIVIALALVLSLLPPSSGEQVAARTSGSGIAARWAAAALRASASVPDGVRVAFGLVRQRRIGLLGAPAWWGFDIAVLWASFHAFGSPPPTAVLVVAYFTGMLANLLPLPGGIGGVEGGMIGAFIAFGVPGGLALVAVLTYRAFSFWLPTIPAAIAYLQLRHTVHGWEVEPEPK
jgi:uncharacterized membrane protein YbhN (UPF0104 family)